MLVSRHIRGPFYETRQSSGGVYDDTEKMAIWLPREFVLCVGMSHKTQRQVVAWQGNATRFIGLDLDKTELKLNTLDGCPVVRAGCIVTVHGRSTGGFSVTTTTVTLIGQIIESSTHFTAPSIRRFEQKQWRNTWLWCVNTHLLKVWHGRAPLAWRSLACCVILFDGWCKRKKKHILL